MRFDEKLKKYSREQIWQEYCGFLDIGLKEYMYIQESLMQEQMKRWMDCPLGKRLLRGAVPSSIEEFREKMPLTTYSDYAADLFAKKTDSLCAEPSVWIQTTWEGGLRPIKLAPYSREMLDTYRHNLLTTMLLASARKKGDIHLKSNDCILYGGAPLPYATGLMPSLFAEDINFTWLPDSRNSQDASFSQRISSGFSLALKKGVDYFFGIGSVAAYITENFGKGKTTDKSLGSISFSNAARYLKGKYVCKRDGRTLLPGDIFHLKALFLAGTDAVCYKDRIAAAWGIQPVELAAGTESTEIASETWEHRGMVFFPNSCFYEFIPKAEMERNLRNPSYVPRTVLMDEVAGGEDYELVLNVLHGGAFMRYRIGDMYRCLSAGRGELPRFTFLDRVPSVIDIAGFTRITESSMKEAIRLSRLDMGDWLLKKEFSEKGDPFLHLYAEIPPSMQGTEVTERQVLIEHLSLYFKYFDSDYKDLKKLLNMEPLQISILKFGTISEYEKTIGSRLPRINPDALDIGGLMKLQTKPYISTERNLQ